MSQRFGDVYDDHVWRVYSYFAYRQRSREQAEDLTQATFERALRAWPRYDSTRAPVGVWLLAIARNLLIDHHRAGRDGRERHLEDEDLELMGGEDPGLQDSGLSPELAQALETLGAREREVLALRFGADLDGPEIAELLGLSLANVQQISSRSLRKLRTLLEPTRLRYPSYPD